MLINYETLLDILISSIIPKTIINVEKGNKIFGGAIIDKKNFSIITIGLNNEIENPILHGEISTINNFFDFDIKLDPSNYIFLSTHQPCSMCLSAITWAGFNNFYFFFPYSDTKNKFSIPHDLNIFSEIFNISEGNYNTRNAYWNCFSIINEINKLNFKNKDNLLLKIDQIYQEYEKLSIKYQQNKMKNKIPLN